MKFQINTHKILLKSITYLAYVIFLTACFQGSGKQINLDSTESFNLPDPTLVVDCQLPARIKRLGPSSTYLGSRRAIKTTSQDCEIRGGEYVAYDRADFSSALSVWLPLAENGDPMAQHYVASIYSKNIRESSKYNHIAYWLKQSANQNYSPAQFNLGYLYEHGFGVEKNPVLAKYWYQRAAGLEVEDPPNTKLNKVSIEGNINIDLLNIEKNQTRSIENFQIINTKTKENLSGSIRSELPLISVTINDIPIHLQQSGKFSKNISDKDFNTLLELKAVDQSGLSESRKLILQSDKNIISNHTTYNNQISINSKGNFYALIIGNSTYRNFANLVTPTNDAQKIAKLLRDNYKYKKVKTILNANRYQIITAINSFKYILKKNDSFLIYYAGHGALDEKNKTSQWLPVDADLRNTANWISDTSISELINTFNTQRVLIIADSCYAGMMASSSFTNFSNLQIADSKKSRTVLTSGGVAPVLDNGGNNHSLFAAAFINTLLNNSETLSGTDLYRRIVANVLLSSNANGALQIPQYAPIKHAGHEAGDFYFLPAL